MSPRSIYTPGLVLCLPLSLSLSLVDAALRFFQFFPPTEIFVPFHRIFPRPFRLTLRPGSPVLSSFVFTGRYLSIYKSFYSRPARQTATQQQQPRFSGRRVYATLGPLGARTNKRLAKPSQAVILQWRHARRITITKRVFGATGPPAFVSEKKKKKKREKKNVRTGESTDPAGNRLRR